MSEDKENTSGSASLDEQNYDNAKVLRNMKDTVFRKLFSDPEYLLQMYQSLHPEDKSTTVHDLKTVTLDNIFVGKIHNDLGFIAKDRLIVMVEAQSTWSVNISARMLLYLAATYLDYIQKGEPKQTDWYSTAPMKLPVPELYVIYTGTPRKGVTDISLRRDLFKNRGDVDVKVKVLQTASTANVVEQYIFFCRMYNYFRYKKKLPIRESIIRTLDECIKGHILEEFLRLHREEVFSTMEIMFNALEMQEKHEQYIMEEGVKKGEKKGIKKGREEGRKEGRKEGIIEGKAKGKVEGKAEVVWIMHTKGYKPEEISECTGCSVKHVRQIIKETKAMAKNSDNI